MLIALTREVGARIGDCELTHRRREPIDLELARLQHRAYEDALARLGCTVLRLPERPDLPDSVFVEDTAVVLDELAVLARPGALSRRPEVEAIAAALAPYRASVPIAAPATLDGGDVLRVGRRLFVGLSTRTDEAGCEQLRAAVAPFGYAVEPVEVAGCLHLKSAATAIAGDRILLNPDQVDGAAFAGLSLLAVDPAEPEGANALLVSSTVLYPAAFPRTLAMLRAQGLEVLPLEASELAKAEGGLTCCSLIFEAGTPGGDHPTSRARRLAAPTAARRPRSRQLTLDTSRGYWLGSAR